MVAIRTRRIACVGGLLLSGLGGACRVAPTEPVGYRGDSVNDDIARREALQSTLLLGTGCTAAKVGPRHLLVAARCVVERPELSAGSILTFRVLNNLRTLTGTPSGSALLEGDAAGDAALEASTDDFDASSLDGGTARVNPSNTDATIASVEVHPTFTAFCQNDACGLRSPMASRAMDVAVIVLDADLVSVPTIPVDLDPVGQGDELLALASGCMKLEDIPRSATFIPTISVPTKSATHLGSAFLEDPSAVPSLDVGYVVTPGVGWHSTAPATCTLDIGAPLLRADRLVVAGVTSNFTTFGANALAPVTLHHTRVDEDSGAGVWLTAIGVETTHSCSLSPDGCVERGYDGGFPSPPLFNDSNDAGVPSSKSGADLSTSEDEDEYNNVLTPSEGETSPRPIPIGEMGSSSDDDSEAPDDESSTERTFVRRPLVACDVSRGTSTAGDHALAFTLSVAFSSALLRRRKPSVSR